MKAIVAVSRDWGIGYKNRLLFSIPEDMKFFRETTKGAAVIMGRATLESLPGGRPLKNRRNIVISSRKGYFVPGAETAESPAAAAALTEGEENVFVIGGASVYRQMLPYCSEALVTLVDESAEADCFFPNLDEDPDWELSELGEEREYNGLRFRFAVYRRREDFQDGCEE